MKNFLIKKFIPNANNYQEKLIFLHFSICLLFLHNYLSLCEELLVAISFIAVTVLFFMIKFVFQILLKNEHAFLIICNLSIMWLFALMVSEKFILLFVYFLIFASFCVQNANHSKKKILTINFLSKFVKDREIIANHWEIDFPMFALLRKTNGLILILYFNAMPWVASSGYFEYLLEDQHFYLVTFGIFSSILANGLLFVFIEQIIIFYCNPIIDKLIAQTCVNCAKATGFGGAGLGIYHLNATAPAFSPIPLPFTKEYQEATHGYSYSTRLQNQVALRHETVLAASPVVFVDKSVDVAGCNKEYDAYINKTVQVAVKAATSQLQKDMPELGNAAAGELSKKIPGLTREVTEEVVKNLTPGWDTVHPWGKKK